MSYNHLEFIDNLFPFVRASYELEVHLLRGAVLPREKTNKGVLGKQAKIQGKEVVATRGQRLTPFDLIKSIF